MQSFEGAAILDQLTAPFLEHVPDRSFRLFDVTVRLGVGDAVDLQPDVQFFRRRLGVKKRSRNSPIWFST